MGPCRQSQALAKADTSERVPLTEILKGGGRRRRREASPNVEPAQGEIRVSSSYLFYMTDSSCFLSSRKTTRRLSAWPQWSAFRTDGSTACPLDSGRAKQDELALNPKIQARATAGPHRFGYSSRSAAATGIRAARTAGSRPPARPMKRANTMPWTRRPGVIRKAKAICEKL